MRWLMMMRASDWRFPGLASVPLLATPGPVKQFSVDMLNCDGFLGDYIVSNTARRFDTLE